MKVRDVMKRGAVSCSPDDTLENAAKLMWENDCGALPVVDFMGDVVGMITDRDTCMAAYTRGIRLCDANVASVMSKDVWTVHPDQEIDYVESTMRTRQIRRLPVVEMGSLVGIISLGDIARYMETHAVRGLLESPTLTKTLAAIVEPRRQTAAA